MAAPRSDLINVAPGTKGVHLGRKAKFGSVSFADGTGTIYTVEDVAGKPLVLDLHGRGNPGYASSRHYTAACLDELAYGAYNSFTWSFIRHVAQAPDGVYPYRCLPVDYFSGTPGGDPNSRWMGFTNMPTGEMNCITERRLEALLIWLRENARFDPKRLYCAGGSMGAYGTLQFALRKPEVFAAIYLDRPQWRYSYDVAVGTPKKFAYADFAWNDWQSVAPENSPMIRAEDGGGRLFDRVDHLTYISNPAKKLPWIGWSVGTADTASRWEDHLEAYEVLKASRRGFAFYWNAGDHSTGPQPSKITDSYKIGLFELGKGYPGFRRHSLDADPYRDPEGGINIGLTFRSVKETKDTWECEVSSIVGACEVDVFPISEIFKGSVPAKRVSITGANQWTKVTFAA